MKRFGFAFIFTACGILAFGQGYLGRSKTEVMQLNKDCEVVGKYDKMVAFKCNGVKAIFYFSVEDSTCDLYAADIDSKVISDTIQKLLTNGYHKTVIKYIEPFLVSKKSNHQKFPSTIYTNGKIDYYIMPVSINGKSTELNAVITKYSKPANLR